MRVKKVDVQQEMIDQIITSIQEVIGDRLSSLGIGEMVDQIIKMTEDKVDESKVYAFIAKMTGFTNDNIEIEKIYTIIKVNPLTQTHFPFDNDLLKQLKETIE